MSGSVSAAPTPTPAKGSWEWCAENYLDRLWWKMDRQFIQQFSGTVTCSILDDLCRKYGVARTFSGISISKYQPLADALNRHAGTVFTRTPAAQRTMLSRDNVPLIVEEELTALFRAYGEDPLSALTKGLWMKKQHPVVIYDSTAKKGMKSVGLNPGSRYQSFYDAWIDFFESPGTQTALDNAVVWAATCPSALRLVATQKISAQSLNNFIASPAFRNRVLDRWFTFKGGATNW